MEYHNYVVLFIAAEIKTGYERALHLLVAIRLRRSLGYC